MTLNWIEMIGEAVISPTAMRDLLHVLIQATGAKGACFVSSTGRHDTNPRLVAEGCDPAFVMSVAQYPDIISTLYSYPTGIFVPLKQISQDDDALNLADTERAAFAAILLRDSDLRIFLILEFSKPKPEAGEAMLALLLPHLRNALGAMREIAHHATNARRFEHVVGASGLPVALISKDMRLGYCNAALRTILSDHSLLEIACNGQLSSSNKCLESCLLQALEQVLIHHEPQSTCWWNEDDAGLLFTILPLPGDLKNRAPGTGLHMLMAPAARQAMLVLSQPLKPQSLSVAALRETFNLTPAQADLVRAMAEGANSAEIARMRGVSKNTIHNQTAATLRRLGVPRQREMHLLMMYVALMNGRHG